MADGVTVKGLQETIRTLQKFGVQVADLKAAFKRIGTLVSNEAKSLAPRRTGKLAGSIRASNTKNKSVIRAGKASVPYAGPINYGWKARNIKGAYFMEAAVRNKHGEVITQLDEELHGLIRDLGLDNKI